MFSEAAPRPRSRHSPCWGPSRLVRSSPSSCLTRNGCFTGFFLIIFPALPFPSPLSSVQSPFVLFVTPPALVGVTRCKGTQCGRGCLSNRPSTYPLGRPKLASGSRPLVPRPLHPLPFPAGSRVTQTLILFRHRTEGSREIALRLRELSVLPPLERTDVCFFSTLRIFSFKR